MTEFFKSEFDFQNRHIGPDNHEINEMLAEINCESVDKLIEETIPQSIRNSEALKLSSPMSEDEFLKFIRDTAKKNKVFKSYIGLGYNPTITPTVILRNIFQNPGWYTQYTPYQAEISQGRLEALLNFQTMVIDLAGMQIANASLLDEGTAAAEAMLMFSHLAAQNKSSANKFFVSDECFPQTIDVVKTRAVPLNIEVVVGNINKINLDDNYLGVLVQYPGSEGNIQDYTQLFAKLKEKNVFIAVAADIMSLALLTSPGELGADAVVGSTQRFGVPMGYGGPHAAYFATLDKYKRAVPGRMIGVSIDAQGNRAYRMALQTREQHIKRDKATSNICTAQVLLAVIAGMYAVYHGPDGIKHIAANINKLAYMTDLNLKKLGFEQVNEYYFDTVKVKIDDEDLLNKIKKNAEDKQMNFRYGKDFIGISINEGTTVEDVKEIAKVFAKSVNKLVDFEDVFEDYSTLPTSLIRTSNYMFHPVFKIHRSETEMLRYIKELENKDLSLTHSMIPLGSCTMKLNATSEMIPVTIPAYSEMHPFAPLEQAKGYQEIIAELENELAEITGLPGVSLQPNSGAQGEYAGLLVIRAYHLNNGDTQRNVCLIPSSAHGTNPASAVMAGMKVVVVNCDGNGNIMVDDLRKKAEQYKDTLAALMVTYPSTHGVFEEAIQEICKIIHDNGGQVYMDGANMNAQVGLTSPKMIGADVCHLNLHKTFCIPHGGGGPGMGPICVAEHLTEFLPSNPVIHVGGDKSITAVSAAPWGSASILLISYAYIKMMGAEGLTNATKIAILNANYIKEKLAAYYRPLYSGKNGRVAHEMILDCRDFKASAKIEVEDIAKRLMDYGFHAPTVSFPVPGTLMVEPTESESKAEMDRFIEAMISIRKEIEEIEKGEADQADNYLKNAPHTSQEVTNDEWKHIYSRQRAAFPTDFTRKNKFWPPVSRINNAYGDRNLICSCNPISDYVEVETVN